MADSADLHMHSFHSDGTLAPAELAERARAADLRAISLTDHDTMAGWAEFSEACGRVGVEAIPGVELSAQKGEREAHILGYFIRPESRDLAAALEQFQDHRLRRAETMIERLNELGVPLTMDTVRRIAGRGTIGRPHVAEALAGAGLVSSYNQAFQKYLRIGRPAYVPKARLAVSEAASLIHESGGLAVLAHPSNYYSEVDIAEMAGEGLDGVEITHPRHTRHHTEMFSAAADRNGLFTTGGSDYHGGGRGEAEVGRPRVAYEMVEIMKERL